MLDKALKLQMQYRDANPDKVMGVQDFNSNKQIMDNLRENIDGINYIWCKTTPYGENGLKRVINIFSFLKKVKQLRSEFVKQFKPDLVIASSKYK